MLACGIAAFAGGAPERTHALKRPAKLEMLRPGEVKPQGWLRDWCVTARNGYISRMDEIDQAFPRAWSRDFHPRGKYLDWPDKDKGAWCAEGGAYWFEGMVRLAWELDDEELKAYARKRLEPLLECMNPNSIAFIYWMNRNDPAQMAEVEKANHGSIVGSSGRTTRAFLAYYEATGDERALRALKWCLDDPRFYFFGNPLTLPAPACDTWRYCGDEKIAAALDNFFATKPYPDKWPAMRYALPVDHDAVHMRVRRDKDPNKGWSWRLQHGVVCYESMLSWVKGTLWTGEYKYLSNVRAWLDLQERACRQPHGVTVADEQYGWAGPNRGTETCVVAGDILLYSTLAGVTGEGRFADHVERSFFNAGAACVSRDFMHHVYFQTPNRPDGDVLFHAGPHATGGKGGSYETKHWPLCCTAALLRILPGYVQWMWMKPAAGGLAATLYAPNTLETDVDGTAVRINTKTDYPFNETLEMSVATEKPAKFPLRLRIPEWCVNPSVAVNCEKQNLAVGADGFAVIDREWKTGDVVSLRFPMTPRAETMRDYNDGGKPYVSLSYGPLLFAYGLAEKDENTPMPGQRTDWRLDSSCVLDGARVVREAMPEKWDWPLAAPLRLRVKSADGEALELVPYGCAKLRVAMFPDDCGKREVPTERMREVYEAVKTPHKVGMVLTPEEGEMIDNPNVFRHGGSWYMMFIRFDGKGYETHLAKSDDLLKWTRLGCIFRRGEKGTWDSSQTDGWPSLFDTRWDGPNTLNTFRGKYWMMYLGGAADGYETDPLSTGVAWTDDPSAVREWTRYGKNPVMSPSDPDARDFEKKTIYKHFTVEDPSRSCGGRFVNFYNAKPCGVWRETIGMAVSDDMLHWRRVGGGPVVENGDLSRAGISGDPMIRRIGDLWVMFYFGCQWKSGVNGAFDTFACSYDLKSWTKWDGEPLVKPSEPYDAKHAHKPWVLKHDGVVYHFYCAVGNVDGREVRGIALATSEVPKKTGSPSFDAVHTEVLALRDGWLAKAEAAKPRLFHRKVVPVALVKTVADASAFQGWRVESAGAVGDIFNKPLVDGDSYILDFGEHLVGTFSFKLTDVRCVDAPIRIGFTFAEVPLELAEDSGVTMGSGWNGISRAWVQKDVVTVDCIPSVCALPRRYAFRYVKVDVLGCSRGKCRFENIHAVAETSADESALKPWIAPSPEMAKIEAVARRTLRDCMQTVFEDGPKRDRRLWLGDLRLEALANYATYRNFDIVRRSLYLLAGFVDDNGMVHSDAYERPAPRRGNCRIFDYVALFAPTVLEYLEASGDRETAEDLWPLCFLQLDFLLPAIDTDGVFRGRKVGRLLLGGEKRGWCVKDRCSCKDHCPWCFIDHSSELNRQTAEQGVLALSFRALMRLGTALGKYEDVAFLDEVVRRMERGANEKLWDESRGLYVCEGDAQASMLGQAWLVLGGIATGDRAKRCLRSVMADASAVKPVTPYAHHYFVEALHVAGLRREADEHLKSYWGRMVELGADTFWEVFVPDNHRASPYGTPLLNSYCHAWSCAPAYFLRNPRFGREAKASRAQRCNLK